MLYRIIYSVITVVAAWAIKRWVADELINKFTIKLKVEPHTATPIKKIFAVVIYLIAFFLLLGVWGLQGTLTGVLAGAGIAGIVIGLAIRDIASDLLAGIILFFDHPFKIGDAIVLGDVGGQVLDIGLRSTKIKTWDGVFVTLPNNKVYSGIVKNYTKYDRRRLEIVVGVDYDSNLDTVQEAITRALNREDVPILKDPAPIVALENLSASSIDFKVLFWYSYDVGMPWITLRGKLIQVIVEEFKRENITIPFPQVTISSRMDSMSPKEII
ncbi:mechanosensitive ion channel family protein [Candidatus Aerophobetes bacterium]|nr:mechanosensitive ion channel family protein [Candidatus Aerophobetes bacterium]